MTDALSLKNKKFTEFLKFIYQRGLEIKEITETATSASYFDCYLYIDNGNLATGLYMTYWMTSIFQLLILFFSSNIPSAPVYEFTFHSQFQISGLNKRKKVLTIRLMSQRFERTKLEATLKKLYGRHYDLVCRIQNNF